MATKTQGACTACRARKVKCTPGTPRCARCTAMGIQDCHYTSVKKRGVGNTLRMGQACIPCRQRKNKCDARQPCTTCVNRDRGAACKYEGFRPGGNVPPKPKTSPPRDTHRPAFSDPGESSSSPSFSSDLRERSSTPPKQLEWQPSPHMLDGSAPGSSPDAFAPEKTVTAAVCPPCPTIPALTVLPSIHFQTIPRPLQIPSPLIPPDQMRVSCAAGSDLDMTFRLRALCRLNKIGIYFTQEKQDAILRGDSSNTVVHRHFLDAFQVLGVHLCDTPETPTIVLLQARYVQASWESFIELNQTDQERVKAQALILIAHGFTILGFGTGAQLYLLKACTIIDKENLQFIPEYGSPAELSEQIREEIAVLSQAIYLENYFYLTSGGSPPVKTSKIEKEFRSNLQRVYPCLLEICPLTMRTQSILLVRDAVLALNPSADQVENASDQNKVCHDLVRALDVFSSDLAGNLQRFAAVGDASGAETIWGCCVICLAHLAALCHLTSQTDLASSESMNALYDATLNRLGNLSLEIRIEKYSNFDVLTWISWKRALGTIDARIGSCLGMGNVSLQHWGMVIGKACADFQSNFTGFKPDSLASLVMAADGRSVDSNYPNFVVPTERERFGI